MQILNQKKADLRKPKGSKAYKGSLNMPQKPQAISIPVTVPPREI
jgi:hypothetical protein